MCCLLPASHSGAGSGRSRSARSASGHTRFPLPGPSGLSSGVRAAPRADRSCLGLHGLSSPAPSGVAEDDRDSISGSVDLDRDDSFRSVLRLIREFHGLEEPASVASKRCKTSLAPIYGLQSESPPALQLLLSPLRSSLLEDTYLALARFVEDQTVHGFLPVPDRRHRRYYRTSTSSFPGPYTVPPGLASITLDKVSESKKRSVSLSHSQASSLETMLSSVCEVTSWLDWWLFTCGGFREHLPVKVRRFLGNLRLDRPRLAPRRPLLLTAAVFHPLPRGCSSRLRLPLPLLLPTGGRSGGGPRVRRPFRGPRAAPVAPEVNEKRPGKSPDGVTPLLREGGCLSPHWSCWQSIGASSWVLSVLRDGYHIPFLDSPPPLSRYPVSFPTYRAGSPRSLALHQEVKKMLSKDALEIVLDPGPGFYSRLFLVEKVTGLATRDRPLSPERVCLPHPVQDGDSRICAPVR